MMDFFPPVVVAMLAGGLVGLLCAAFIVMLADPHWHDRHR